MICVWIQPRTGPDGPGLDQPGPDGGGRARSGAADVLTGGGAAAGDGRCWMLAAVASGGVLVRMSSL